MPGIGDPAPPLSGVDVVNGGTFSLEAQLGNVVVVDFSGLTWCEPCKYQAPILQEAWEDYAGGAETPSVKFVVSSVNDSLAGLEAAVGQFGLTMPVVHDEDGSIWNEWGVGAVPSMFVVDTGGTICAMKSGVIGVPEEDRAKIDEMLESCGVVPSSFEPADLRKWVAVMTILFGVTSDGGGLGVRPGGVPKPIDPWGPLRLSRAKREMLAALAMNELASSFDDSRTRAAMKRSSLAALKAAAQRLEKDLQQPARDFEASMPVR